MRYNLWIYSTVQNTQKLSINISYQNFQEMKAANFYLEIGAAFLDKIGVILPWKFLCCPIPVQVYGTVFLKPEMDAAVYSPLFHSSATATLHSR